MIKKLISFFLCFVFCVNLIQVIGEAPGGGPFTITVSVEGNGHFMYGGFSENNRVIEPRWWTIYDNCFSWKWTFYVWWIF